MPTLIGNYVQDPVLRSGLTYQYMEHDLEDHDDNDPDLGFSRYGRQGPDPTPDSSVTTQDEDEKASKCIYFIYSYIHRAITKYLYIYISTFLLL